MVLVSIRLIYIYIVTFMPRSLRAGELELDLEIEKIVKRLRKEAKYHKQVSSSSTPLLQTIEEEEEESIHSARNSEEEEVMAEQNLRQLNALNVAQQPLYFDYRDPEVPFALKSGLILLLPTFRRLENEYPHKHLKEFHIFCLSMRL
ncbi:hypothetical protein ES332_D13G090800v1 [Gossypium tomentosum]|uniref:Uncharacterized protein n=1 Tax=Gossypium tomentosum TaxID=34277 RepID=A0A5D2HVY1_GOSTO|nr:hypothetical protein ES332_D13G090800v1 [Gossypium tomentosum]